MRRRSRRGLHVPLLGWRTSARHRRWRRFPAARVMLALAVAALLVGGIGPVRRIVLATTAKAILFAASPTEPEIVDLDALAQVSTIYAADGRPVVELVGDERRKPVQVERLPDHVVHAVLAAEDENFFEHEGVDPTAIYRAVLRSTRSRKEGGSTISQQLAKLNFTTGERTYKRKFKEIQYVRQLERTYDKHQLLERYVNQIYFGGGAYGLGAAAETFFATTPEQLTPAQAATLAGKIRAPESLDPRTRPEAVQTRRNQVLRNMHEEGWLDDDELAEASAEPLVVAPEQPKAIGYAPHFVEFVKREASRLSELGPDRETRLTRLITGGFRIETTIDPKVFDATTAAVAATLGDAADPLTAVASVEPGTGAIRSLFGGLDFFRSTFDVSSQGGRQPGSAFKPFVYLAALEAGVDPRSQFNGSSGQVFPCYGETPVDNYAGEDAAGAIDLDTAMARSVNVTFVEVGCLAGVDRVFDVAQRAGVPASASARVAAAFLGGLSRGVTALTMAEAYATFAAGGVHARPYSIERILDPEGEVVYERSIDRREVFDRRHVGVLNRALRGVVTNGTARAADLGRPVAGKTGTTQQNVDAWFAGFVPQLATAVWNGFEPPRPMVDVRGRSVTGGSFPAQIFAGAMRAALSDRPTEPLPEASPDGLGLTMLTTTTTAPPALPVPPPETAPSPAVQSPPPAPAPAPASTSSTTSTTSTTTTTTTPTTTTSTTTGRRSTSSTTAPTD